jgi:glycosyltransferase involved in cell wall biosynthesis
MITILHLITGLETGGAQRMLYHVASHTDRSRFRPVVVSMTGPDAMGPVIEAEGVPLRSLGLRRGMPDPRGLLRLIRLLHEFRPAILQTWLYHADLLGLAARPFAPSTRLLWNIRCTDMASNSGLVKLLARCSGVPDAVVVNAEAGQRYHQAQGYRPKRWVTIPNGIDTSSFRADPEARRRGRAELGIPDDVVAILLPARYHPMKDHATFLAAAALASRQADLRFACAGAGCDPANRELTGAITTHRIGDRVQLLGERRDLAALYPAFDIVTLSSAYGEGFPNVLGEAMACAVPCVATDTGDAALIIGDTGIIVPPRDPPALAEGWRRLAELVPEGRAELGTKARARIVERYDIDQIVPRFEALYEEIAGTGAATERRRVSEVD